MWKCNSDSEGFYSKKNLCFSAVMWRKLLLCLVVTVSGRYEDVHTKQEWWEYSVFYQVYVRSFMDSDNDGIGDLNGITTRLEYFKELGVHALILSPIFKSPSHDYGYDISDFYTIHPEFGTMEDFEHLLKKAKTLNLKIILDFVPNHTSNESDWFIKSANKDEYYSDWFIWEKGHVSPNGKRSPPNNWVSMFKKSAWTYMPTRDEYYLHQFGSTQPDLNYRNPVVLDEIKNILKFWLEKDIAGLRMSAFNFIYEVDKDNFGGQYPSEPRTGKPGQGPDDYGYLQHVYTKDLEETYDLLNQFEEVVESMALRNDLPRVILIEAPTNIKHSVRYYGDSHRKRPHVIPVNFGLLDMDKSLDARDVKYTIDRWMTYKPLGSKASWMSGNHDKSRVPSRFRSELIDAFNMLVLLLPGVAISYMGEEIGMHDGFISWSQTRDPLACGTDDPVNFVEVSRDPSRTPFQWSSDKHAGFTNAATTWLPVVDNYEGLNVAAQRSAVRSHYQVYRTLVELRMRPAFKLGRFDSLALNKDVYAFKRWYNDDTYVVIINFGKRYNVVNLTAFDLVFGQLEVEASSILSSRSSNDNIQSEYVDLTADEALVLRMQV